LLTSLSESIVKVACDVQHWFIVLYCFVQVYYNSDWPKIETVSRKMLDLVVNDRTSSDTIVCVAPPRFRSAKLKKIHTTWFWQQNTRDVSKEFKKYPCVIPLASHSECNHLFSDSSLESVNANPMNHATHTFVPVNFLFSLLSSKNM